MSRTLTDAFAESSESVTTSEAEWLASRAQRIGASEAPVICGVSRFNSAFALYHKKMGTLDGGVPSHDEDNEAMYWGRSLEPVIVNRFETVTGRPVFTEPRVTTHVWKEHPELVATLDAVTTGGEDAHDAVLVPLEVKNVSAYLGDEWLTDAPVYYQVQVQHQMMVCGAQVGYLAALIGGNTFRWCKVERDDRFIELMLAAELEFLDRLRTGRPPEVDGSKETKEFLRKLYPKDNGQLVSLPVEAMDWDAERERGKQIAAQGEAIMLAAENKLKAALGDASGGILPNGVSWTYKWQRRVDPPRSEPKVSEFRVLRRSEKGRG